MKLIADHILAGEEVRGVADLQHLLESLRNCEFVRTDSVAPEFWDGREKWSLTDFPIIRPPWDYAWFECQTPDVMRLGGSEVASIGRIAVLFGYKEGSGEDLVDLSKTPRDVHPDARGALQASLFFRQGGRTGVFPARFVYLLDEHGQWIEDSAEFNTIWVVSSAEDLRDYYKMDPVDVVSSAQSLVFSQLLAISLMHSRNARVSHGRIPRAFNASHKRKHNRELLKYYVLDVDPAVQTLRRDAPQATGIKQAMHSCRGHFKDYRKGAGLFGRLKGLYWYGAHVRGDDKIGQIDKDYQIAPSKVTVH